MPMKNVIPQNIIATFADAARAAFADDLVGVYLHGSAVMGCYNPSVSDLDFIVVVAEPPTSAARRAFMDAVARLDAETPGKGIEMSVVTAQACKPFVYPTPFELHYSRMHATWYARDPGDYVEKMRGVDADLAAHFTVIRGRGLCLCGAPVDAVFGPVPEADYIDSIWEDVSGAEAEIAENPMYLALNLARVLAYLRDRCVLSKREGGAWALENLPEAYHPAIRAALDAYDGSGRMDFDPELARQYARDMLAQIDERRNAVR